MTAKTVLLVDDSLVARMLARALLERARPDWTVVEAVDGLKAVAAAQAQPFDYVLLDVNMPGIDGLETARRLRAVVPDAAITLLTANIQDPVRAQAGAIGVGFIAKPLSHDALEAFLSARGAP